MGRRCAPENLEIPGLVLTHHPGMTQSNITVIATSDSDEAIHRVTWRDGLLRFARNDVLVLKQEQKFREAHHVHHHASAATA